MTRREMLAGMSSTLAALVASRNRRDRGRATADARQPRRRATRVRPSQSRAGGFDILEHCRGLGMGAVRMSLPSTDLAAVRELRKKLESYGMRVIISLSPPKEDRAVAKPTKPPIKAVAELGAVTTHASFTARRYEEFDTFEAFKASFERHKNRSSSPSRSCAATRSSWRSRITRAGAPPSTRPG